jgi:polysaccharide export outer membrane protein
MTSRLTHVATTLLLLPLVAGAVPLQGTPHVQGTPQAQSPASPPPAAIQVPADYAIGVDDGLSIVFWRDPAMSADVVVRPDGKISLPLLNDVDAAGRTPEQLRVTILERAKRFVEEPSITVVVRAINSRKVFITGQVAHAGSYSLANHTTVLQLIAMAGGLTDYADGKKIKVLRVEQGRSTMLPFNYEEVRKGKKLDQNIELRVGDTIIVP